MSDKINMGQELLNVPFSEMVSGLATAIAQAQMHLDRNTVDMLRIMGDKELAPVTLPYLKANGDHMETAEITTSMIGAGFQPTFYQFTDTIIEVKMAIKVTYDDSTEKEYSGTEVTKEYGSSSAYSRYVRRLRGYRAPVKITSTPVDATYCNKYGYTQEGSSTLRTRLVPVPPNNLIQQQLDAYADFLQKVTAQEMAGTQKADTPNR